MYPESDDTERVPLPPTTEEIVLVIRALMAATEESYSGGEVCQHGEWMIARLQGRDVVARQLEAQIEAEHAEHYRERRSFAEIKKLLLGEPDAT